MMESHSLTTLMMSVRSFVRKLCVTLPRKRLSSELNEIKVESTGATEKEEFIDMLVNQPAGGRKIFLTRENI